MIPRRTLVVLAAGGMFAGGLPAVTSQAQAAKGAVTPHAPNANEVTPGVLGGAPGALRQASSGLSSIYASQAPFAAEKNQTYFYQNNPAYVFFVLYNETPIRQPGLYLYNAATKQWYQRATLDQLPVGQWVRVTNSDWNAWPLALAREQSGTVMANWL